MTKLVKKDKTTARKVDKETAKQKLESEMAKVKVKVALDQLTLPGLKIWSVVKNDVYIVHRSCTDYK